MFRKHSSPKQKGKVRVLDSVTEDSDSSKTQPTTKRNLAVRHNSLGATHYGHNSNNTPKIESLNYIRDESEVYRSHSASTHYKYRGRFWNDVKHEALVRYTMLTLIGVIQAIVAYSANFATKSLNASKFDTVGDIMQKVHITGHSHMAQAFLTYFFLQLSFAAFASFFVYLEPMCGGSGIPEVKVFLNGIDLPRIHAIKTGICKILGVCGSVSAGLPVGKEGPMVHSGAVVASAITSGSVRDDKARRDFVACGAAAGVCTAFSAPIGGILFALEEGSSYWSPSITFRTFYCSMIAIATLYALNTLASQFGKVGFDRLFSFGNFIFEGEASSFAVFELILFVFIGAMGGLIGAVFNDTNLKITKWRIKHVNFSKGRRFLEVLCISSIVSVVSYGLPYVWHKCTPLPDTTNLPIHQSELIQKLVPFGCKAGQEYNEIASLMFTEANDALKLLFHMHIHTFSIGALFLFFIFYISLATITYGIAVPSGLFVPSLLSGAAFGRLVGNLGYKLHPQKLAFSNTYSLIGAAAVLGGMARMTISLTVILLEATGNEQFVLPLMITLFTARVVGELFNDNLYHIHIHLKKGVHFLEAELKALSGNHNLLAGHIMSNKVLFFRPVEKVGVVFDILREHDHTYYPVIDTEDRDILFGCISRHVLCTLLQQKAFGVPSAEPLEKNIIQNHIELKPYGTRYLPLVQYNTVEREYPRYPQIENIEISEADRDLYVDLRPYSNTAPYTIQETTPVKAAYDLFRSLGLKLLVVVNRYNQCVGVISRDDLVPEALAKHMITKGKHV